MSPADEQTAKLVPTEGQASGAVVGSHDNLEEQLHNLEEQLHDATLKDLQRPSHQSKPVEDEPMERDDLHSGFTRLDLEASERKALYDRLVAIENEMKRRGSRGFARYLVAILFGVAATLAWQSYGEATKQVIATRAPELGWSPRTKQTIASWMQQLGWTKPPAAAPVAQTAPTAPAIDPEKIQQMTQSLAELRQIVEQLAAGQDQMTRVIGRLETAVTELIVKIPEPPPQPPAAPARKPTPTTPPPSSRTPTPPRLPPHP
jgi:hypothetical protein